MVSKALGVLASDLNHDGCGMGVVVNWQRTAIASHLGLLVADWVCKVKNLLPNQLVPNVN